MNVLLNVSAAVPSTVKYLLNAGSCVSTFTVVPVVRVEQTLSAQNQPGCYNMLMRCQYSRGITIRVLKHRLIVIPHK